MIVRSHNDKHYILLNKPFNVLCQFTDTEGRKTLNDFGPFPPDIYSVGRLDFDSEGLLLLTDDRDLNHRLTDPAFEHPRTYLVQIEGVPSSENLTELREGVTLNGKKTRLAVVRLLAGDPGYHPRIPGIRVRKAIPTCWIEISLREGRNRQVRRMTAAIGHPTLRLVRTKIGGLDLGSLLPGESRVLTPAEAKRLRTFVGL